MTRKKEGSEANGVSRAFLMLRPGCREIEAALVGRHGLDLDICLISRLPGSQPIEGVDEVDLQAHIEGRFPSNPGLAFSELQRVHRFGVEALLMADRTNWSRASVSAMFRHSLRAFAYWKAKLEMHRPDVVVFHDIPHLTSEWALYHEARANGIPTVHIQRTLFHGILTSKRGIHEPPQRVAALCRDLEFVDSEYVSLEIPRQRDLERLQRERSVGSRLVGLGVQGLLNATTSQFRALDDALAGPAARRVGRTLFNIRTRREISYAARRLNATSITSVSDLPDKFVYFPLHLQPEATTVPDGGMFWEQLNVVALLTAGLPPDVSLVVKEHPQMMRYRKGWLMSRDRLFYEELSQITGARVAHPKLDSSVLIDRSLGVATLTGSAGWESLLRGKRTLLFARPWYHGAPGTTEIANAGDVMPGLQSDLAAGDYKDWLTTESRAGRFLRGPWRDHGSGQIERVRLMASDYADDVVALIRDATQYKAAEATEFPGMKHPI